MSRAPAVWIMLPVYNEAPRVPRLLDRWLEVLTWLALPSRFVLVDDGSSDGTAEVLAAFAARRPPGEVEVLTHSPNQGLGATLRDGLRRAAALAGPDDAVVVMDADDTHPPEIFPVMLTRLEALEVEVVIASRYRRGASVSGLGPVREGLSRAARWLYQGRHRIPGVRDYTCGYRVYRARCLQEGFARHGDGLVVSDGFDAMAEVLLSLAAGGARCAEVALPLDYTAKAGASHMNVWQTAWRSLRLALRG